MVPALLENSTFQSWYKHLTEANNRLDNARVLFQFSPQKKNFIFLFVLLCDVYITKENRHTNKRISVSKTRYIINFALVQE